MEGGGRREWLAVLKGIRLSCPPEEILAKTAYGQLRPHPLS